MSPVAVVSAMLVIFSIAALASIAYVALHEDDHVKTTRVHELRVILTTRHRPLQLPIEEQYPSTHRVRDVVFNMIECSNAIQIKARALTKYDLNKLRAEGLTLNDRSIEGESQC